MDDRARRRRLAEMALLYFALPGGLALARLRFPGLPVIPVLWLVSVPLAVLLARSRGFPVRRLLVPVPAGIPRRPMAVVLVRALFMAALLAAALAVFRPGLLFSLPRGRPALWCAVLVAYPVLSVVPQGVLYRAFFRARYAVLFPGAVSRTLAAAACFSFSHVFFLNPWAMLLTFAGGIMFYGTYEKTGSLFLSNAEHSVYGDALFTIGYGAFIYHGTLAMTERALGGGL